MDSAKKKGLPVSTFYKKTSPAKSGAKTVKSDQGTDDEEPVAQTSAEGSSRREGEIGGNLLEHIIRQVNAANQAGERRNAQPGHSETSSTGQNITQKAMTNMEMPTWQPHQEVV